jgi:xanthine dehydrogenase YagT iron-sulfur-binding subunit
MAADEKDEQKRLSRRNFLKGAGAGTAVGIVAVTGLEEGLRIPTMQLVNPPTSVSATLTASASTIKAGQSVTFSATQSGGTAPYTISINCGDGTTLSAAGSHTYSQAGSYTVLLTVADSQGVKGYSTLPLTVAAVPSAPQLAYEQSITLNVNGADYRILADNRMNLRDAIRDKVGMTGTKDGCGGLGECGACTVLADGKAILSCLVLAVEAQGMKIVTSDGLADRVTGKLDPIQQAFIDNDGFQCGYCTGGYMMTAKSILAEIPHPTKAQVMDLLSGNLCRCEAYPGIIKSVLAAGGSS